MANVEDNKNTSAEIFENPEAIQDSFSKIQDQAQKYQKPLMGLGIAVIAVLAAVVFYQYYKEEQEKKAQAELFPAIYLLEKDSLDKALEGDNNFTDGLLKVSETYGVTEAANLSNYYAGVAYLKKGDYDNAIKSLKAFSATDYLVQGRAYCLIGDAYLDKGETDSAIEYYQKAVKYNPNEQFTPGYLMKLAIAQELKKDYKGAADTYNRIIKEYEKDPENVRDAKKYLARIEPLIKS